MRLSSFDRRELEITVNDCKLVYKVCYNEEVTYGEMFDQQNICKADVAILIMRWVALNAECQTKKLCLKKCPNLHQLWLTFYAHYFVFNLCANFGECIIFCTTIFNRRLFLSSEQIRDLHRVSARHYTSFMYNSRGSAKV